MKKDEQGNWGEFLIIFLIAITLGLLQNSIGGGSLDLSTINSNPTVFISPDYPVNQSTR